MYHVAVNSPIVINLAQPGNMVFEPAFLLGITWNGVPRKIGDGHRTKDCLWAQVNSYSNFDAERAT